MSRGKRRLKGESIGGQFAGLPFNLIKSRAFAKLTGSAKGLLICMLTRYNGTNNGTIPFGYSDGKAFGFTVNTTRNALIDLWDKGFIKRTKAGVYRGNVSEWLLTFRSDDRNGHARTDDWKQYPNNEKDAELIAAKRNKYARARKASECERIKENSNDNRPEPATVTTAPESEHANAEMNILYQSLENLKRKQGLL